MKLSAATAVTSTADTSLIYLADTDDGGSSFSTKKITKANLLSGVLSSANTSLTGTTAIGGTLKLANQGSDPTAVADNSFIFAKDVTGEGAADYSDLTISYVGSSWDGAYTRQTEYYQLEGVLDCGNGVFKTAAYYYFVMDSNNSKMLIYSDDDDDWLFVYKMGADFRASAVAPDDALGSPNELHIDGWIISRTYENSKAQPDDDEDEVTYGTSAGAASSEVHVMDEAGNVTKISPHNDAGEWEYFSRNTKTGKTVRINMEKFIHTMEELTGETFIEYN